MFENWIVGERVGQSTEMGENNAYFKGLFANAYSAIIPSHRLLQWNRSGRSFNKFHNFWLRKCTFFFPVWICTRYVQKCARKMSCTIACTREQRQATEKIFAPEAIRSNATQHEATCCVALLVSKHAQWTYSGAIRYVALRCVALLLWKPSLYFCKWA